jgi:hypothetical protein
MLFVLSSCHVTKRRYRKGFYIETTKNVKKNRKGGDETTTDTTSQAAPKEGIAGDSLSHNAKCDEVVLEDGTRIEARVLEVSEQKIRYRKCSLPDGPVYVCRMSGIKEITYRDGEKYSSPEKPPKEKSAVIKPKKEKVREPLPVDNLLAFILSIVAFVCMILGLSVLWYFAIGAAILGLVAVVIGATGLQKRFKGFAIAAVIIGAVSFLIAGVQIIAIFLKL